MDSGLILMFGKASLALSVIYWLGSLFLLFAAGCVIVTATARNTKKKLMPKSPPLFPPMFVPEVRPRGKATVWIGLPMILILAVGAAYQIGKDRGYGIRDHELVNGTISYGAVYVQRKLSDNHFVMQPQYMKGIDSDLCPGPPVDWKQGETLRDWTFEQQKGCKRVISYHRYPEGEKLDASIQVR